MRAAASTCSALRCGREMLGCILVWEGFVARSIRMGARRGFRRGRRRSLPLLFQNETPPDGRIASRRRAVARRGPGESPAERPSVGIRVSDKQVAPTGHTRPAYFGLLNFTGHLVGSCVVACGFAIIRTLCSHTVRFGKLLAGRLRKSESRRKEKSHDSATHRTRRA